MHLGLACSYFKYTMGLIQASDVNVIQLSIVSMHVQLKESCVTYSTICKCKEKEVRVSVRMRDQQGNKKEIGSSEVHASHTEETYPVERECKFDGIFSGRSK